MISVVVNLVRQERQVSCDSTKLLVSVDKLKIYSVV